MPYKRERLPSAAKEFRWFCETYGQDACETAKAWVAALFEAATRNKQLVSLRFDGLLDELLSADVATEEDSWKLSIARFQEAPAREKLKALIYAIRKRAPPWQSHVDVLEITCLGHVPVELYAYYDVDHVKKKVVFTMFDSCGPGSDGHKDA